MNADRKPENPYAFPQPLVDNNGRIDSAAEYGNGGMGLRDYFAAKALQGFWANDNFVRSSVTLAHERALTLNEVLARSAYEAADAMLKEREK